MKYIKTIFILILFFGLIFSIAGACASDAGDDEVASEDREIELTTNENEQTIDETDNKEILSASDNDGIVNIDKDLKTLSSRGNSTYSELYDELETAENYTELKYDYYIYDQYQRLPITIRTENKVIDGKGAIIDMNGANLVALRIEAPGVTIKNLTIMNSRSYRLDDVATWMGAAIDMNSGTIENCNFISNSVRHNAGAVYGTGTIKNCNFVNNEADLGGAIYLTSGTVENCNFTNNTGRFTAGAIYIETNGTITNCNFIHDTAGDEAGAIIMNSGVVKNCSFTNNRAGTKGGAIYLKSTSTLENCNFTNNKAWDFYGGAVYFAGDGNLTNCNFNNNYADSNGGAVYFNGKGNVTNSNFTNNSAMYGGAINMRTGTVTNCNFINNTETEYPNYGGGAINIVGTGTVTNCNFINNHAEGNGGAVCLYGGGTVTNSNFVNNTAKITGGGIYCNGHGTITNCNFTNNRADSKDNAGGAIFISTATISYCNFYDNKAKIGSAIRVWSELTDESISNSVFLNNRANADSLDIIQNENKIEITFKGSNNYLNAIWTNSWDNVNFNNVTYWGANGITNTDNCPTQSKSDCEAGQNITIVWRVNGIEFNMTKVTDINGKIVLDMIAGNCTITARHNEDSYYTQIEKTVTFNTTGNETSLELSASNWTATATVNPNNAMGNVIFTVQNETSIVKTVEATLNNGIAEMYLTELIAGEYNITATYTGDNNQYPTKTNMAYTLLYGKNTYSELSREIGSGGNIKLMYDYYTFDYGPTIEITTKNSIIDGNGAVIDMAGSDINALLITASNVTIKNLTIKNANISDKGGAIYFTNLGTVENCNFINNSASDGGAVYFFNEGNVRNSNFTNNSAGYGGAICFTDNIIGSVENCNFINNTAYFNGGAICFENAGNVSNCNFTNNQATSNNGGAVYFDKNGEVTKCNFNNNKAPLEDGGAICFWAKGKLTDSSFTGNYAQYGGAVSISLGSLDNCTFTGNNATVASALYFYSDSRTSISNSIFLNNRANADTLQIVKNGTNIEITLKGQNNLINAIYCKQDTSVSFTNVTYWGADGIANTGNTTISLSKSNNEAGQNITVVGIVNGTVINTIEVTNIDGTIVLEGITDSYLIVACHNQDSYYSYAEAIKTDMQFYVNITSLASNNRTVNITAKSDIKNEIVQGKLLFILENSDEINANYTSDGNWWAEYTFDEYGEHNVTASYIGLEDVTISNATITLTKRDSTLTLDNVTLDYGDSVNITVTTEGATDITAEIDGNEVVVSGYTIPISGLNAGNYTLTVTTIADRDHNPVTKNATITVNKIDSELTVDDIIFDYNGSGSANVSFTGAAGIDAYINDQPKETVDVKDNTITVSALDAGTYTLTVTTKPDGNHNPVTKNATVTVNKINSTITFDKTEISCGETVTAITEGATGIDAEIDGQPVAVDNFTVSISGLIAGRYTLTVTTVPDANHNPITQTTTITINKINTTLSVEVIAGAVNNEVNIIANVNEAATGNIELIIKEMIVYFPVNGGKAVYDALLPEGDYNVTVTYLGDDRFNTNVTSKNFTVKGHVKKNTSISANVKVDENNVTITVDVDGNATGFVVFEMGNYNISVAVKDGKAVLNYIFEPGNHNFTAAYLGDDDFYSNATQIAFTVRSTTSITASEVTATYGTNKNLTLTLKDVKGNPLSGKNVTVELNGKTYDGVTNAKGEFSVAIPKNLVPKTYAATLIFKGDGMHVESTGSAVVNVVKAASKISAKKKTFKKSKKIKKYTITLKSGKTAIKKVQVTLKINGKTYKAKTNAKGKAVFKIKKLTKKGKYKATIKFAGNNRYNKVTKKVKIVVK